MLFTPFYLPIVGLVALFTFSYLALMPLAYKLQAEHSVKHRFFAGVQGFLYYPYGIYRAGFQTKQPLRLAKQLVRTRSQL